jgi:hypothetical protein
MQVAKAAESTASRLWAIALAPASTCASANPTALTDLHPEVRDWCRRRGPAVPAADGWRRYVLVWFTRPPADQAGTFQASVYDVKLYGYR